VNVAVIPARGGSKRIPRKNVRDFMGRPIMAWPIAAAQQAGVFDHVIVSTDNEAIAQVGRDCGAQVPFIRPDSLSDDHTGTTDVVAHAVDWALRSGWDVSLVCCIYATAALVQAEDLRQGLEILQGGTWEYVFSASTFPAPVFRAFRRDARSGVEMLFPEHVTSRSQDLPEALHDAGQFYWGRAHAWLERKPVFASHSTPMVLPRWRVQDIDDEEDWRRAERVFRELRGHTGEPNA
jgi:pseudaminic acid cytidylyltransferase